jgi:hypothetical protein
MPTITRVTGPWSDGNVLTAEQHTKDSYQGGREVGYDGTDKGGFETLNGQLDLDGNFGGSVNITRKHVRRGAFTLGPLVSGFRQSRDIWYKAFPDLNVLRTPDIYTRARPVLGKTFETRIGCTSYLIDISMDYTLGSLQNDRDDADPNVIAATVNPPFRGFLGVWLENRLYEPSATPLHGGRASTVEPPLVATKQYQNTGPAPDFRRFAMKFRISVADLADYAPDLGSFLTTGWHNISVRVSGRQTLRIHGGAIIVTPIV